MSAYQHYYDYLQTPASGWQLHHAAAGQLHAAARVPRWQLDISVHCFGSGLTLSRLTGRGAGSFPTTLRRMQHHCAFFLLLAGGNRLRLDNGRAYCPTAGELWLVRGALTDVRENLRADGDGLAALHLDFSPEQLRRWQEEGLLERRFSASGFVHERLSTRVAGLVALARPLLQRPPLPDSLGRLTLEAAALELTARLLRFNLGCRNPRSHRARIDEAADIIRAEYRQPLTIAALARRVSLNECYLKRYYKAQTGETIAASLRRHRLHAALRLLNDGATVQQAMAASGYCSPGHFGAAFKKQFGCLPREVVQGNLKSGAGQPCASLRHSGDILEPAAAFADNLAASA